MNQWTLADHDFMRSDMGIIALDTIDTRTGQRERVIENNFHFHHVLFLNNDTLLINHPKRGNGMWMVKRDGTGVRELRPASAPNAHNAAICHQVITANGIYYEANGRDGDEAKMYLGRYDPATDTFAEIPLPGLGYCHTGFDPAGRFLFIESAGKSHQLLSVHHPHDAARRRLNLIRKLSDESRSGQRFHAHPFLTPDRNSMIFTDIADNGFGQIFRADVADLVNLREYW
jgi:hypothetical protein